MNYALIRDGIVQNVIVADASFVALIRSEWSQIELVTGSAGIGCIVTGKQIGRAHV